MNALVILSLLASNPQTPPATPEGAKPTLTKAEEEVRKVEREWLDAYEKRDAEAMNRIVAENFTITFPNGQVQTKPQLMAQIRSPRAASQPAPKFSTEEVHSRAYGDTVVLMGKVITVTRRSDKDVREQSRYTDTYVKIGGRWQVVASHLSNVPEAQR